MEKKAFEVTGKGEWVAGRRVSAGDILMLTEDEARYEVRRGLLRPSNVASAVATMTRRRRRKG